jgi:hypothetical protein
MSSSEAPARKPVLRLDWCSHAAAKYAVEHWHYSRRMPMPPLVSVGAWEDGVYVGCVLFSRGANAQLGAPYGLAMTECAELVRIALASHATPVTRIVAVALKFLRTNSPGLRLLVSYADPSEGHHGGIYQGGGWTYSGRSSDSKQYKHEGRWKHSREVTSGAFGGSRAVANYQALPSRVVPGKHRYLMPLDAAMRAQIAPLAKPYPKRLCAVTSTPDGTPDRVGGATPTTALHS